MQATKLVVGFLLQASWLIYSFAQPERALQRNPLRVDPAHYSIETEMDGMLALRLRLAPDEAATMAYFQDALIVCINECHVRLKIVAPQAPTGLSKKKANSGLLNEPSDAKNAPSPQIVDLHMEAGTTRLMGAGMRAVQNLSAHSVEMLFIEREDLALESK